MAFMMPITKKNYNIYGDRGRKVASETAPDGRKASQASANSSASRRRVRSEGPSLSTSPATTEVISPAMRIPTKGSKSLLMRRVRGSAPILAGGGSILLNIHHHRHNSLPGGKSTAPNGNVNSPAAAVSPTHSTESTSTSSSESSNSNHGFHIKLLSRFKKSLRLKDPAPAAS